MAYSDFSSNNGGMNGEALKKSKIYNNIMRLNRVLKAEDNKNKDVEDFIKSKWIPARDNTVQSLGRVCDRIDIRTTDLNVVHLPLKTISAGAKIAAGIGMVCPPLLIPGLVVSAASDLFNCGVSAAEASDMNNDAERAKQILISDSEVTCELKKKIKAHQLVLTELKEEISYFHRATMRGAFDSDGQNSVEINSFLKEVKMIDNLDLDGISSFLRAFGKLCSSTTQRLWRNFRFLMENNSALADSVGSAIDVAFEAFGMCLVKNAGKTTIRCIAGVNFALAAMDIADIAKRIEDINDVGRYRITPLSKKLQIIINNLRGEKEQIKQSLQKSKRV